MADTIYQIENFIDENITDELRYQNTAAVVRSVLKYMLRNMDTGFPLPPAGAAWVAVPGVSVTGFTVSVDGAGVANFQGVEKAFPAYSYTATAPGEGLLKLVVVYARPDGTYGVSVGDAAQNPVRPPYPVNALFVTTMLVTPTGGIIQQPTGYVTSVTVRRDGVDEATQTGAVVVDLGALENVDTNWLPVDDAAAVTLAYMVEGKERPNQEITPDLLTDLTGPPDLPPGKDFRFKFLSPGGKSINLAGTGHKDFFGNPIEVLPLSSDPEQVVLINNAGTHLTWSLTGEGGSDFTPTTANQYQQGQPALNSLDEFVAYVLTNINTYR